MSFLKLLLKYRRLLVVVLHLALVVFSNYLAFWIRFDGQVPEEQWVLFTQMLPWLVAIRALIFMPFRLYEGLWRYTSIWDLRNIIGASIASSSIFYVAVHSVLSELAYPQSIFILDSIFLIVLLGGVRLARRIYRGFGYLDRQKRILIYGAGDAGEMVARDMKSNPFHEYEPVGFIDDDPMKVGQRIHGLKVMGTREDLVRILSECEANTVLVAMPRSEPSVVRKVVKALEPYKVTIQTLPNLSDLLGGKVEVSQIRNLAIEDLIERAPIGLDQEPVRNLIGGKRVMVTGAGGSIGSELCRQIARYSPASLVLLDRYENGLYEVTCELEAEGKGSLVRAVIGDVTDDSRVNAIIAEHRPSIIFHTAAHKHVPLMEASPCEAVKNNVLGTRLLAEAACRAGVDRFILISTDKAVNPTSVMGATKRVAELIVRAMNGFDNGRTVFAAVRFGNVLGSNGSVVPRFVEQIKRGGPVTVTHPEMRRFFMLIPEAVQLVLHAAALANGGEMYALEMGEQIKVLDMAHNLIKLSGFTPEEEIPIRFIGLRPGEKLYEELVGKDETVEPSGQANILRIRPGVAPEREFLFEKLAELEGKATNGHAGAVLDLLKELVPTYQPKRAGLS